VIDLTIAFALFISIIKIYDIKFLHDSGSIDYNFALIPIFFGIVSVFFKLLNIRHLFLKIVYNLFLVVFTINILISSSRRGLFVFFIIVFFLIFSHIITLIKRNNILRKLSSVSGYYLGSLLLILLIVFVFFIQPYSFKNKALKYIGVQDIMFTKNEISTIAYRYFSITKKSMLFNEFSDKIWSHEFNSRYPGSGWGSRIHKVAFPLKGKNVQIVPKNTEGYLMDSTCNASTWKNNSYSFTMFAEPKVKKGDQITSSVYCYVSEDFNGNWVRLRSEGGTYGKTENSYDLRRKGEWQKLTIMPECQEGSVPIYLYFAKNGVTDFSSLKGYVIFAYPTYEIVKKDTVFKDSLSANFFNTLPLKKIDCKKIILSHDVSTFKFNNASIFNGLGVIEIFTLLQTSNDQDLIRNWVKRVINEDTTYYSYKTKINIPYNPNDAIRGRTDRWKFGWEIYKKEYNWKQKIFGNGFDYLNWYGYYFYKDKTKSDWPHNPFLSVLMYSGIIGLGLYLYLTYRVIAIYLKYIKEYYILFIFFCITFFFSFFSAGNPFDPPVMGFFVMLPFFIDYIHKKDKSN
jgi:hypothetical protein